MRADHPIDRIGERQPQLLAKMLAQRATLIGEIVDAALVDCRSLVRRRGR